MFSPLVDYNNNVSCFENLSSPKMSRECQGEEVPETGFEPVSLKASDFKSDVYTDSTTLAYKLITQYNRDVK